MRAAHPSAPALVLGGLEMACWDAAGKYLDQPISTFFGGARRESFPSMYYVQQQSEEAMVEQANDAVACGFGTICLSQDVPGTPQGV